MRPVTGKAELLAGIEHMPLVAARSLAHDKQCSVAGLSVVLDLCTKQSPYG
jgi:hypothetical protein